VSHEYLPHTADLRAALRAPDLPGLYQSAVDLVRDILVGSSEVRAQEARSVELGGEGGGDDAEAERLFTFVRELLFFYDADAFLPARFEAGAPVRVWGEGFDASRHASERQLKAVTRHGYRFERERGGYRAELVFDI
jgi:SHS2 domain-containing protein